MTSAHFGQTWNEAANNTEGSLSGLTADINKAQKALTSLSKELKPDEHALTLEESLSAVMLEIFNTRVAYGISIASTTSPKSTGGNMLHLDSLAESVPGSSLKSVKINVSGTYETYPELMAYLHNLQLHAVAVTHLKVQEQSFEASLRVYGTPGKP